MRNEGIRSVMKLAHISMRDLSGFMGVTPEWTGRIIRAELSDKDRSRILKALNEVLVIRSDELKQAKKLLRGE